MQYVERYNHKNVKVVLIKGPSMLKGKLHVGKEDRYDVQLEIDNKRILIPKHSILYIEEDVSP